MREKANVSIFSTNDWVKLSNIVTIWSQLVVFNLSYIILLCAIYIILTKLIAVKIFS